MVGGKFYRMQLSSGEIAWRAIFLGGNYICGQYTVKQLFGGQFSSGAIALKTSVNT